MENDKNTAPIDETADSDIQDVSPSPAGESETEPEEEEEYIPVTIIEDDEQLPDDDELYRSNSSRIRLQLEKDGVVEQEKYKKKLNLFQWIADFFFHNKLECIVVIIVLVIAALIGISHIEKSYDYVIAVYTYDAEITDEQLDIIADVFRGYGEDIDGDGQITIDIENYHPYIGWYIPKYIDAQKLYDDIYGDRSNIFILTDEQCRDNIIERFSDFHFEWLYEKEKWVSLEGTAFCNMGDAEPLPVELGIMMFRPGSYAMDIADVQKRHGEAEDMLKRIMEDEPELFTYE